MGNAIYLILIALKNLVTWVTDDRRSTRRVNDFLVVSRAFISFSGNFTAASSCSTLPALYFGVIRTLLAPGETFN